MADDPAASFAPLRRDKRTRGWVSGRARAAGSEGCLFDSLGSGTLPTHSTANLGVVDEIADEIDETHLSSSGTRQRGGGGTRQGRRAYDVPMRRRADDQQLQNSFHPVLAPR